MEGTKSEKREATIQEEMKKERKWGILFLKFLAYGGWIPVAIAILAVFFLVSMLGNQS